MKKKHNIGLFIVLVILVALGIGGYFFIQNKSVSNAAATPAVQTATVKSGSLTLSASGAGIIIANKDVKDPNGNITNLLSAQLSYIQAKSNFDTLAASLPTNLANAQLELATAKVTLAKAKSTRAIYDGGRCSDVLLEKYKQDLYWAQYRYNLDGGINLKYALTEAEDNYNGCLIPWPQSAIDKADAAVKVAEEAIKELTEKVATLSSGLNSSDLEIAQNELVIAKTNLQSLVPIALLKTTDDSINSRLETSTRS